MVYVDFRLSARPQLRYSQVLPWQVVVHPAVHVARDGFPGKYNSLKNIERLLKSTQVTEDLVRYMGYAISIYGNFLVDDPNWAMDFAPNGKLLLSFQTTNY
jgi:gamma-glutamyltranspeptidase/glutathione hydrolase